MPLIDFANTGKDCSKELQALLDNRSGEVVLPPGRFIASLELKNVKDLVLRGSGRNATTIQSGKKNKPALQVKGLWFSRIQDLGFAASFGSECGVLEIDGSDTQGVQGNTYDNLLIDCQGLNDGVKSKYAMTMCRDKQSNGQGSEQTFINCHFSGASQACYYQVGYNALNNQFIGGNFQNYTRNGMEIVFGGVHVIGVGFQSTAGYEQIKNDGWDIKADSGGADDAIVVAGCRTESLRFAKFGGAQPPTISSCLQRHAMNPWWANHEYKPNDAIVVDELATSKTPGSLKLYVAKAAHSSPTFNADQWQHVPFNVVDTYNGTLSNCYFQIGNVLRRTDSDYVCVEVNGDYAMTPRDNCILANTANGPVAVWLCDPQAVTVGHQVRIVRAQDNSHPVTLYSLAMNNTKTNSGTLTSRKRSVTLQALGGGNIARRWYVV